MEIYMGGRSQGKTYTLELAKFGLDVLNEMNNFRNVSENRTADQIFKLIQKYPLIKIEFDKMIGTFS